MAISRYKEWIDVLNRDYITTWTMLDGEIYNPRTHDLVPKREYVDTQIKMKEQAIEALKREKESFEKHYEERLKSLLLEKDQLVIQKNKGALKQ